MWLSISHITSVCQESYPQGRCTPPGQTPHPWADILQADSPLGRHPPPCADTPWADTPPGQTPPFRRTATAVDGMHPTGMHSC